MVKDTRGNDISGNFTKLLEHFDWESEFGYGEPHDSDLQATAKAIKAMIPFITKSEAKSALRDMIIIVHGTAAGPQKRGHAVQILDMLEDRFPEEYRDMKKFLGH